MLWSLLVACGGGISSPDAIIDTSVDDTSSTGDDTSSTDDTGGGSDDTGDTQPGPAQDYREVGPYTVNTSSGSATTSCSQAYTTYTPQGASDPMRVILSHGFARGPANQAELAQHMASWGVEVVTPAQCDWSNHAANAADLTALNTALGGGKVILSGHSAGGLQSHLAGVGDVNVQAVVLLDPTDADSQGLNAGATKGTMYAVIGESNGCNAQGSYDAVVAAVGAEALWVTGSDHCDFEGPTDQICELFCSPQGSTDDAVAREIIFALATAAVAFEAGLDDRAVSAWWDEGGSFRTELGSGVR